MRQNAQNTYPIPPPPPSRFEETDPMGRLDIATARILGVIARAYLDPQVAAPMLAYAMPYVELGCEMFLGPRTQMGKKGVVAVAALRAVKGLLESGTAVRTGAPQR